MSAGTTRPIVIYKVTTEDGAVHEIRVPLVHNTGPGRMAALRVVMSCYPGATTISPAEYFNQTDSVPSKLTPLPPEIEPPAVASANGVPIR